MNTDNFDGGEYLEKQVLKLERKREMRASFTFLCILALCSYVAYCVVYFAFEAASLFFSVSYRAREVFAYAAQFAVPTAIFLLCRNKKLSECFFTDMCAEKEKVTLASVLKYALIAFASAQIMSVLSSFFSAFFAFDEEAFAVESATTFGEFLFEIFSVAFLPAVLEELYFRGIVLTELKKYGKSVAIAGSAFFFAAAHGSVEQMMYGFVYGVIFAYAAIRTGSLATGMIMHFLNNFYSCAADYAANFFDESSFSLALTLINSFLILCGLVCAVFMIAKNKFVLTDGEGGDENESALTAAEKFSVFKSPTMIVYYAVIAAQTLYVYISYNSTL